MFVIANIVSYGVIANNQTCIYYFFLVFHVPRFKTFKEAKLDKWKSWNK